MFTLNDDLSIYATRGDVVFFAVSAEDDGYPYRFHAGDVVRIKVYEKKNANSVVLQKDFPVTDTRTEVEIYLDKDDTKIGDVISKHKDYWYEVVLNDDTVPQTIIGYDEDGAKLFRLFPEGADIPPYEPIKPEDIPIVDDELDMTSHRPIENQAVSRAIAALTATAEANEKGLAVEKARFDNLISEDAVIVDEPLEYLEYITEETKAKLDASITSNGVHATIKVNFREANLLPTGSGMDMFIIPNECRPIDTGDIYAADSLRYIIKYDNERGCYVLGASNTGEETYAPTGAGVVTFTYALAEYELKDIRVGADGTIYPTAGEAVRAQLEAVKGAAKEATPQMYGAKGDGVADDTEALQNLLANHRNVYIPEGVYMIRTSTDDTAEYGDGEGIGVEIPSNTRLVLHPNAVLKGIPNASGRYRVLWAQDSENITISGGKIECDRTKEDGQHGFGIAIRHCKDVLIDGVSVSGALGDCINVGCYADSTEVGSECENIVIKNCDLSGARRQGITFGGVDGGVVDNCYIHDIKGTDPQAGIDIEVNNASAQINDNIKINNCVFSNNGGNDIVICQNEKTNITVDGCKMAKLFNENGVVVSNCTIETLTASSKSVDTLIKDSKVGTVVSLANKCLCEHSCLGNVRSQNKLRIVDSYMECAGENIMLHAYGEGHIIVENSTIVSDGCKYATNGNKFDIINCVVDIKKGDGFERGFYVSDGTIIGCTLSIDTVEKPLFAKTHSAGSIRVVGNKILTDFQASILSGATDFYMVNNVFFVKPTAVFNNATLVHDNITL